MTVAAIQPQITYIGNGATTEFSFTFEILEDADLLVTTVNRTTLEEDILVLNTHYTVDPGEINTIGTPIASTHAIVITRRQDLIQDTTFSAQGSFSPESLEAALDYLTMLVQNVENLVRAQTIGMHLPIHTIASPGLPSALHGAPAIIFVQDAAGGGVPCFSDGTNWRRMDTRGVVA